MKKNDRARDLSQWILGTTLLFGSFCAGFTGITLLIAQLFGLSDEPINTVPVFLISSLAFGLEGWYHASHSRLPVEEGEYDEAVSGLEKNSSIFDDTESGAQANIMGVFHRESGR